MDHKIKVLYIVNHAVPYGANVALLNILDNITSYGIEPMVVVGKDGRLCEELEKRNIPFTKVNHFFSVYPVAKSFRNKVAFIPRLLQRLLINIIAIKKLTKIAKDYHADLIHTNIGPTHIGYSTAKKLGIPHVWHIREYQDLDFNYHPFPSKYAFVRKLRSKNNYSIAITYGILNHFELRENARVIYDGVSKKTQTQFIEKKEKYFLYVGHLTEKKGVKQLLSAFICFATFDNEYKLLIAGDGEGPFFEELHQMAMKSAYVKRIHFLGFRKDVCDLMAKATALVVPSFCEGFGFITVEAMFNGCLVIGNNSGGTKEILEKENLGILYSGQDELVSAMRTTISNGIECYYPMLKKAQERAKVLYSIDSNVEKIYKYYMDILGK
jgi:glycosyltransferase involved in cell wall biosynthesis